MKDTTYIDEVLRGLQEASLKGQNIELQSLADSLNHAENLEAVCDWITRFTTYTKKDWNAAAHRAKVKNALGEFPNTANDLVQIVVKRGKISAAYNHTITRNTLPVFEGSVITPDDRANTRLVDNIARILDSEEVTTETLKCDLRQINDQWRLKFSRDAISDAVSVWFRKCIESRKLEVFSDIAFEKHRPLPAIEESWKRLTDAFCPEEHEAAFVRAVLSKFIWQVKRKMLNLPIYDHLMPVLLGPQGVGKSTLIREVFLKPLAEMTINTDFSEITDNRNHDIWRYFVLFLGEMGHAGKADMDTVKNLITLHSLQRRPMATNITVSIRQNATFIGCSNKEIEQLIRDETGNRRFAALRFSSTPDHAAINAIDAQLLWQSVDEHGEDPMKPFKDLLREKQSDWRERSQVEQWLEHYQVPTAKHGRPQKVADLHDDYLEWAAKRFHNQVMNVNVWSKEFKRVTKNDPRLGWTHKRTSAGMTYTYSEPV